MERDRLYKIHQITLAIIYIALMVFFVCKCLENGADSTESSQRVADATATVINGVAGSGTVDSQSESFHSWVRKFIGHYSYFVLLGSVSTLFYLSLRKKVKDYLLLTISFSVGFIFAVISEFLLEAKTLGRTGSWSDVGIDYLGFITLSIVIVFIYYLIKFKKSRKNSL